MPFTRIDAAEAQRLITEEAAQVVDIRDRNSYEQGHIADATHLDNETVQAYVGSADKSKPLVVCCYHGNMSQGAAEYVDSMGLPLSRSTCTSRPLLAKWVAIE